MLFPKLAHGIAILSLILGLCRVGIGFYAASIEPKEAREAARVSYIGSKTSGEAIEQGIYVILFAVVLGTLARIARNRPE